MNVVVNERNVQECWEWYEMYKEKFRTENYSDASYQEFVEWCYEELYECPNCGAIVLKDEQYHLHSELNQDVVCDECIEVGGYYE